MEHRRLGASGPRVSAIALGTVSLGVDYGIRAPGDSGLPEDEAARGVLREARRLGVSLFDTAPAYGASEALLGSSLGGDAEAIFATKVSIPKGADGEPLTGVQLRDAVRGSVDRSRATLGRERLDAVQIHNATVPLIETGELAAILRELRDEHRVGLVGASVYTEAEALAAIASGAFQVVQVAYNLLDRRMAARVFPAAVRAGVGVLVRSAYLKGALTEKAEHLPPELAPLKAAVEALLRATGCDYAALPRLAVRYCLAAEGVSSVLIGARTADELALAVAASREVPLSPLLLSAIESVRVEDERLLNPAAWPVP